MKGFTLLEVIVALVIAGLAAAALFEAVGTGLHATQTASMYDQAIVRATSHLAAGPEAPGIVAAMSIRQRGFALLIVLWIVGFLALLGTQIVVAGRSDKH